MRSYSVSYLSRYGSQTHDGGAATAKTLPEAVRLARALARKSAAARMDGVGTGRVEGHDGTKWRRYVTIFKPALPAIERLLEEARKDPAAVALLADHLQEAPGEATRARGEALAGVVARLGALVDALLAYARVSNPRDVSGVEVLHDLIAETWTAAFIGRPTDERITAWLAANPNGGGANRIAEGLTLKPDLVRRRCQALAESGEIASEHWSRGRRSGTFYLHPTHAKRREEE